MIISTSITMLPHQPPRPPPRPSSCHAPPPVAIVLVAGVAVPAGPSQARRSSPRSPASTRRATAPNELQDTAPQKGPNSPTSLVDVCRGIWKVENLTRVSGGDHCVYVYMCVCRAATYLPCPTRRPRPPRRWGHGPRAWSRTTPRYAPAAAPGYRKTHSSTAHHHAQGTRR
jgi:hypothetical protein